MRRSARKLPSVQLAPSAAVATSATPNMPGTRWHEIPSQFGKETLKSYFATGTGMRGPVEAAENSVRQIDSPMGDGRHALAPGW